jgi:hypothetical protein
MPGDSRAAAARNGRIKGRRSLKDGTLLAPLV